jgi:hypothetical protein
MPPEIHSLASQSIVNTITAITNYPHLRAKQPTNYFKMVPIY